ncbi:hypothetical protein KI387_024595, partial [Taxus chinensis]
EKKMLPYGVEGKPAKKTLMSEWKGAPGEQAEAKQATMDWWFEDLCMLDMDYFVRTIAAIRAKGVSPDMIGAVISNYAMKWLPGLAQEQHTSAYLLENLADTKQIIESADNNESSAGKNRFILENLVSILPSGERRSFLQLSAQARKNRKYKKQSIKMLIRWISTNSGGGIQWRRNTVRPISDICQNHQVSLHYKNAFGVTMVTMFFI